MINAYWEKLRFEIPSIGELSGNQWRLWIDTFRESPDDINNDWDTASIVNENTYAVQPRSVVCLFTRIQNQH